MQRCSRRWPYSGSTCYWSVSYGHGMCLNVVPGDTCPCGCGFVLPPAPWFNDDYAVENCPCRRATCDERGWRYPMVGPPHWDPPLRGWHFSEAGVLCHNGCGQRLPERRSER